MAGSPSAPSLEESSSLEDIMKGMKTMKVECIHGKSPEEVFAHLGQRAMRSRQEINEHPVAFGLRLRNICFETRRQLENMHPALIQDPSFIGEFKKLEKAYLVAYYKGLRNEELKMQLEQYKPERLRDAIVFAYREYKTLNAYHQSIAEKLWVNTDLKCEYCINSQYHLYDCLLPKTN